MSEKYLIFVMGIFALLTSTIFTGSLFDQMFVEEKPRQLDTMAELLKSDLMIQECAFDVNSQFL